MAYVTIYPKELRELVEQLITQMLDDGAPLLPTQTLAAAINVILSRRPSAALARMVSKELKGAIALLDQGLTLEQHTRIRNTLHLTIDYFQQEHPGSPLANLLGLRLRDLLADEDFPQHGRQYPWDFRNAGMLDFGKADPDDPPTHEGAGLDDPPDNT